MYEYLAFAILCFVATGTALPIANTTTTNDRNAENNSINSIGLPASFTNLNQSNSIEKSEKPDDSKNISKEYLDGRGDAPPHDLDLYEEQGNNDKGNMVQANQEPTVEAEKLKSINKFEGSTSVTPITEAHKSGDNNTSANYTSITVTERMTPSLSTSKSLTKQEIQDQHTSTPVSPIVIQHNASFNNLNQSIINSIEKSDDSKNISKEHLDGRGDAPPHDLDLYEEQGKNDKGSMFQANKEPTVEAEKLKTINTFEGSQSASVTPVTEAQKSGDNTTSANYTSTTETERIPPNKSLTKQGLQDLTLEGSQITQVPKKQSTSVAVPESKQEGNRTTEGPKLKINQKVPTSNVQLLNIPSGSQQQEIHLKTQHIDSKKLPKSDSLLKEELKSVSKPKPATNLSSSESQQNGKSLNKQEIMPSKLASVNLEGEDKAKSKESLALPLHKSHRKEQVPERKDTQHIIPLSESNVLQKEREPDTKAEILPFETKEIGFEYKPKSKEASTAMPVLESQQKTPGRKDTFFLPLSDREDNDIRERYNCPWLNVPVPPLLFGNEIQGPVLLSPIPVFLPYRNPFIFKRSLIKYHTFVIL